MWPVDGVVGENGAFWFRYDPRAAQARAPVPGGRRHAPREPAPGSTGSPRRILAEVPGCALASDQLYREADLAIDFCEDVRAVVRRRSGRGSWRLFEAAGCTAKVSSIHVNGWFGSYDKLTMTRLLLREVFAVDLDGALDRFVFVGDSPNDQPMFALLSRQRRRGQSAALLRRPHRRRRAG